jgi:hypothetical protein
MAHPTSQQTSQPTFSLLLHPGILGSRESVVKPVIQPAIKPTTQNKVRRFAKVFLGPEFFNMTSNGLGAVLYRSFNYFRTLLLLSESDFADMCANFFLTHVNGNPSNRVKHVQTRERRPHRHLEQIMKQRLSPMLIYVYCLSKIYHKPKYL